MHRLSLGLGLLLCSTLLVATPVTLPEQASDLDFQARVRAQRAIEHVYHHNRIDHADDFEAAVPTEVLEEKVRRFFRQSRALEQYWKTTVTANMLDRELRRLVRDTHEPDRLWELFAALENDPVLIRECLARPILVDRLVQNFYAYDEAKQEEAIQEEVRRTRIVGDSVPKLDLESWLQAFGADPVDPVADRDAELPPRAIMEDCVSEWMPSLQSPSPRSDHVAVWTGSEMIVWGPDEVTGSRYDPATDTWSTLSTLGAPELDDVFTVDGRGPTGVWTGSVMIVCGWSVSHPSITCGRYDLVSDAWSPVSTQGAPSRRLEHTAVWTGSEVIVWGGIDADAERTGGRYDPATDSWSSTSLVGAPAERFRHAAVWTGNRMIVWGGWNGAALADGGVYDPETDTWTPTSTVGAPVGRVWTSTVWTGEEMIVWGGVSYGSPPPHVFLATGARYDPAAGTWTAIADAPEPRAYHSTVWTGNRMIVWGGADAVVHGGSPTWANTYQNTGFIYDPSQDLWTPISATHTLEARGHHTAVWTGNMMIVWGGKLELQDPWLLTEFDSGGRYDPISDIWTPTSASNLWDRDEYGQSAVWTGNELIVWGGRNWGEGYVYNPATGVRTRTSLANAPDWRRNHAAVWSGTEMIVWGGISNWYRSDGGRYDPVADSWAATSQIDGPDERTGHTAIWTGGEMIVWGGYNEDSGSGDTTYHDTGGRYDPVLDTWTATSIQPETPLGRWDHNAVWTGNEMIVWGGNRFGWGMDSGARYDPGADSWRPTSAEGAPDGRWGASTIWSGDEMIVWGGRDRWDPPLASGGRYDPQQDTWSDISTVGAPSARYRHTAVWTGFQMIIWGGFDGDDYLSDGRWYSSTSGTWTPMGMENAPSARRSHVAVWTGLTMIVWGGEESDVDDPDEDQIEGGIYVHNDPDEDGLCGSDDCEEHNPFCGSDCTDADLDGYCDSHDCDDSNSDCSYDCADFDTDGYCAQIDCDDAVPGTSPGAPEINDGLDNQCPGDLGYGLVDEISDVCGFHDPMDANQFSCPPQAGATRYEVARSPHPEFPSWVGCLRVVSSAATWVDSDPVPEGTCFYYLARSQEPNLGSWGADSGGIERNVACHR